LSRGALVVLGIAVAALFLSFIAALGAMAAAARDAEALGPHLGPVFVTALFAAVILIALLYSLRTHGRSREALKAVLQRVLAETSSHVG
jgi:hypothetical protein